MNHSEPTPFEDRIHNPYEALTPEDFEKSVGRVLAVDLYGGGIIETADTVNELRALMDKRHPDIGDNYRTLPVSDLSRLTWEDDK